MPEPGRKIEDVCSLSPEALRERLRLVRGELLPLATRSVPTTDGHLWSFPGDPETRARLEELVALERRCCSGIDFALESTDGGIELRVRGVDPNSAVPKSLAGATAD